MGFALAGNGAEVAEEIACRGRVRCKKLVLEDDVSLPNLVQKIFG